MLLTVLYISATEGRECEGRGQEQRAAVQHHASCPRMHLIQRQPRCVVISSPRSGLAALMAARTKQTCPRPLYPNTPDGMLLRRKHACHEHEDDITRSITQISTFDLFRVCPSGTEETKAVPGRLLPPSPRLACDAHALSRRQSCQIPACAPGTGLLLRKHDPAVARAL